MSARPGKRLMAYIMDIIMVACLMSLISLLPIRNTKEIRELHSEMETVHELFLAQEISFGDYFDHMAGINCQLDKEESLYQGIYMVVLLLYFVLFPYIMNGQTVGKKAMKIQLVAMDETKLSFTNLLIRNVLLQGIAYNFISILLLYVLTGNFYFIFHSIFGFMQIILVIVSGFMVIYKEDHCGLHDVISSSKVVEET